VNGLAGLNVTSLLILVFLAATAWKMNRDRSWLAWAALIVFADQLIKACVRAVSLPGEALRLTRWGPSLYHLENPVFGGGLTYDSWSLWGLKVTPATDIIGCVLILAGAYWILDYAARRWKLHWPRNAVMGLGAVIGGGMSNWIDRMTLGAVTDFLPVSPTLVCNLADLTILAGCAVCVGSLVLLAWSRSGSSKMPAAGLNQEPVSPQLDPRGRSLRGPSPAAAPRLSRSLRLDQPLRPPVSRGR